MLFFRLIPLAYVQTPRRHNPQGDAKDHQHSPWVGGHQCFPHKSSVKVYLWHTSNILTSRFLAYVARLFRKALCQLGLCNTEEMGIRRLVLNLAQYTDGGFGIAERAQRSFSSLLNSGCRSQGISRVDINRVENKADEQRRAGEEHNQHVKPLEAMRVKLYESHLKIDTATDLLAHLDVKETHVCVRRC